MSRNHTTYQGPIEGESWLPCQGWPGYEVSDVGRVRSCWGVGRFASIGSECRILTPGTVKAGYKNVCLMRDRKRTTMNIHVMVMEAFVGPCPPGLEVCHNDSNPANNVLSNLRYGTRRSNKIDLFRDIENKIAKLKPDDIPVIRSRIASGEKDKEIAADYGVSPASIYMIRDGRTWSYV